MATISLSNNGILRQIDQYNVRTESADDVTAIRNLNERVFGQRNEADLIDTLRKEGRFTPAMSIVAENHKGQIIGHALFSEISCKTDGVTMKTAAIAPGAIKETDRSLKLARALMEAVISQARNLRFDILILLARPRVYERLGFSAELAKKIRCVYSDAGDALMALELTPGVLSQARSAEAIYPDAFLKCDGKI